MEKGIKYECSVKGAVDDYYIGDDVKLKQVLINILGNAFKFTPSGGFIQHEQIWEHRPWHGSDQELR